jgi:hypothetical protein
MFKVNLLIAINSMLGQSRGVVLLIALVLTGCVTSGPRDEWKIGPLTQTVENQYFSATISPAAFDYNRNGYEAFDLTIRNKTMSDIRLDWNETLYIENDKTRGGFMFAGMVYEDRNNPRPPDVIMASSEFRKTIWPNALVSFYSRWSHELIPPGHNGVNLSIRLQDKEIHEEILLDMKRVPLRPQ